MFNQIIDKYDFVELAKKNGFTEEQALFMFTFVELIQSKAEKYDNSEI